MKIQQNKSTMGLGEINLGEMGLGRWGLGKMGLGRWVSKAGELRDEGGTKWLEREKKN